MCTDRQHSAARAHMELQHGAEIRAREAAALASFAMPAPARTARRTALRPILSGLVWVSPVLMLAAVFVAL